MNRREFCKGAGAVSALAAAGVTIGGLLGNIYYMVPGEVLANLHKPPWTKIVMANYCSILNSTFEGTVIDGGNAKNSLVANCMLWAVPADCRHTFNIISAQNTPQAIDYYLTGLAA